MIKKILGCLMLSIGLMSADSNLKAMNNQVPICITPAFEFRCFIDKFTISGMISVMTATLGMICLHNAIKSYSESQTTFAPNHDKIPETTMLIKARNYGIAAAALLATTAALCCRSGLCAALSRIPQLLRH